MSGNWTVKFGSATVQKSRILTKKDTLGKDEMSSVDYLIGLVSFGVGCARKNYGAGYTSVSYYRDWISSTVQHMNVHF